MRNPKHQCRECLASFETAERVLPLPRRGRYLGALRPSQWSFTSDAATLLLGPVCRAPRKELGENSNDGTKARQMKEVREAHAHGRGSCPCPRLQGRSKAPQRRPAGATTATSASQVEHEQGSELRLKRLRRNEVEEPAPPGGASGPFSR